MSSKSFVYRLTVQGVADGQAIQNVFDYRMVPFAGHADTTGTVTDLLTAFRARWRDSVCVMLPAHYAVLRYRCIEINGRTSALVGSKPTYGVYGELIGDPATDAGVPTTPYLQEVLTLPVHKRTSLVGKKNRGLIQFGPMLTSHVVAQDPDRVSAAGLAAGNTAGGSLLTLVLAGATADTAQMVLFHRADFFGTRVKAPTAVSAVPVDSTVDVDTAATDPFVGTQLHRKVRRKFGS